MDVSSSRVGPLPVGLLDFTQHMRRLCEDIVARLDVLRHVDMDRVAVSFAHCRSRQSGGLYASLTPLRFAGGTTHAFRRGRKWTIQRVLVDGREMLYVLNFYLPRFLDLPLDEKLTTVLHELWHIGPRFDGDLRRFGGRCYAHSGSQRRYDATVRRHAEAYLAAEPPEGLRDFLRGTFRELHARHGRIVGMRVRTPKLVKVD